MDWDLFAPMIVSLTLILTAGGVLLFRPLAKRLGDLLEIMSKQRRGELPGTEVAKLSELLETMGARLSLLEDRQDFTDALLLRDRNPEPTAPQRAAPLLEEPKGPERPPA